MRKFSILLFIILAITLVVVMGNTHRAVLAQAQGRSVIPKNALQILEKGEEFLLLSLNPNFSAKSTNRFCNYAVLGKMQIKDQDQRQADPGAAEVYRGEPGADGPADPDGVRLQALYYYLPKSSQAAKKFPKPFLCVFRGSAV